MTLSATFDRIKTYIPLLCVFVSGIGFSIQTLVVKLIEIGGYNLSFECVFFRGLMQIILSFFWLHKFGSKEEKSRPLFGESWRLRGLIALRSLVGYGGIIFSFLAVERLPMSDAIVLIMLSPLFASIGGFVVLGEPWRFPEFTGTVLSLIGASLVAKPTFIFGFHSSDKALDSLGVIYAITSAVSAGMAYVCIRVLGTTAKMHWANVCIAQGIGQMALSIPNSYIFGKHIHVRLPIQIYLLIIFGGMVGSVSQVLMTIGMQREKSATATAMRMSDVLFGFIWQALFTHDKASILSIIGAILVTFSILIIVAFKKADAPINSTEQSTSISLKCLPSALTSQSHSNNSTGSLQQGDICELNSSNHPFIESNSLFNRDDINDIVRSLPSRTHQNVTSSNGLLGKSLQTLSRMTSISTSKQAKKLPDSSYIELSQSD